MTGTECGFKGGPANGQTQKLRDAEPTIKIPTLRPMAEIQALPPDTEERVYNEAIYDREWLSDDGRQAMYQFREMK